MNSNLQNKIHEVFGANNISYILNDNGYFSVTGYKVMQNHNAFGLLKCSKLMYNGKIKLVYLLEDYKPLSYVVSRLGVNEINLVLCNLIQKAMDIKSNGFFIAENIELDINKIFVDLSDYSVHIIYFPLSGDSTGKMTNFENEFRVALIQLFNSYPIFNAPQFQMLCSELSNGALSFDMIVKNLMQSNGSRNNFKKNDIPASNDYSYNKKPSDSEHTGFKNNGINVSAQNYNHHGMNVSGSNYNSHVMNDVNINYDNGVNIANNNFNTNKNSYSNYDNNFDSNKNNYNANGNTNNSAGNVFSRNIGKIAGLAGKDIDFGEIISSVFSGKMPAGNQVANNNYTSNAPVHLAGPVQPVLTLTAINSPVQFSLNISKPEFVIGKNENMVDGVINFNPAISRVHCKIVYNQGSYFLIDAGSANGTFLNDVRLNPQQTANIQSGDCIKLANSDFIVTF